MAGFATPLRLAAFVAPCTLIAVPAFLTPAQEEPPTAEQASFFENKVRPVLAERCFSCHGGNTEMGGLKLDSRSSILKGGDTGPAMVPGNPGKSLFIQAVHQTGDLKMPKGGKLTASQIADLEAWVRMGAPWPSSPAKKEGKPLWSLLPVQKPSTPRTKSPVKNPVDAFVLAKLESSGFTFSKEADRRTLIRRLSYDLTGLPPSPSEVQAFTADKSPNAYEGLVDRLLASPHYGERQARLWMDVARYADTKGYVFEEDRVYHHAYTYRDWLIRAFNRDLPYNQFILRQLAADRLPEVANDDDKSDLAAMGFLTLGRRFLNDQNDIIDDRIDVTMRGFQGLTVSCARCHDHKFDPIPTQDYYSLHAVFASSTEVQPPISDKSVRDPWIAHNQKVAAAEKQVRDLLVAQTRRLRTVKDLMPEAKQVLQMLREEALPEGENRRKLEPSFEPEALSRLGELEGELKRLRASAPPTPEFAMAMADRPNPGDGVVFKRGNPGNRGEPAPRRFLKALSNGEREHWKSGSGRLELAKAIASRQNPLTARVIVNRIWQQHFGQGLVRTPSDFGHQGEKPTHPELLDHLAWTFLERGWSIKGLHRQIVTSATYRQSSEVSAAALRKDPDNRLLARQNRRRLDLEQMRDSLLMAAANLDLQKVGGKSVDLWSTPYPGRRSVYGFIERQNLPGVFRTFDLASPDATSPRRFQTTVPQQALFFLNSAFAVEQARSLANRVEFKEAKVDGQRVRRLYLTLFGRLPTADEEQSGVAYLKKGEVESGPPTWLYGYGSFDSSSGKVTSFTPLTFFGENGYRVGREFPDPKLGWIMLNAAGGHPGQNAERAAIRRWIAPETMNIRIQGLLKHSAAQGDGVRVRVVSSRLGLQGEWTAHNKTVPTGVASVGVQKGDLLDFVVDPLANHDFDSFEWAPVVQTPDGTKVWNAAKDFGPPRTATLSRLALYAQALMMTNEFLFVD